MTCGCVGNTEETAIVTPCPLHEQWARDRETRRYGAYGGQPAVPPLGMLVALAEALASPRLTPLEKGVVLREVVAKLAEALEPPGGVPVAERGR